MKNLKALKKVLMIFLSLVLILSCTTPVLAANISSDKKISSNICKQIIKTLDFINDQKDLYGLTNVNVGTISVGNPILAYEYSDNKLNELDFLVYPLLNNGCLVAFAIKDNKKSSIDITTEFVDEINSDLATNESFAFIYDNNSCYIYTSRNLKKIFKDDNVNNNKRDTLNYNKVDKSIFESVELNGITEVQPLGDYSVSTIESNTSISNIPIYYSLGVSFVSQATNSNYCWASCVACIGNFLKSKSYTGEYVAQYVYGTNYNQSANPDQVLAALNNIYGVSYTYYSTAPSDSTILNSISSLGRPLYSRWSSSSGSHATVIYGINVIGGYIYIMNPASGFMSASSNGYNYTYISLNSGNTFTLYAYAN